MSNFWLIQRGTFKAEQDFVPIGLESIVHFDYMGSAEFEWGALPKAYRRIMYHFTEYGSYETGIYTSEHKELIVFCKKDCAEEIIRMLKEFVEKPYCLKEYSELEKVPCSTVEDTHSLSSSRRADFWWCIDRDKKIGNWMAFLEPQRDLFTEVIIATYHNWWLLKSSEEREKEYSGSLDW